MKKTYNYYKKKYRIIIENGKIIKFGKYGNK